MTDRPPAWRRVWEWLLEDPSKAKRDGPTEREKALQKVAERDRELRRRLIRETFQRRGKDLADGITYVGPGRFPRAPLVAAPPRPTRRPTGRRAAFSGFARLGKTTKGKGEAAVAKGRRTSATATTRPKRAGAKAAKATKKGETPRPAEAPGGGPRKVFPLVAFWHALLGERRTEDAAGQRLVVPPPETDWRWNLHRFFRSNVRAVVYARSLLLLLLVLSSAWVSLYASTGYDYSDLLAFGEPEDPRDAYKLPFFVIESGSMMHPGAPWGRVGTIDPGDIVVIEKYRQDMEIETFYGTGEREVAGAKGDVIMYLPVECRTCGPVRPIIHRAIAYIERDVLQIPNPDAGPGQTRFVSSPRFTVEEFGIIGARSVTIPELGLVNYQPDRGGYITRGDNPRSNNWADQALGVTPFPVPEERIIGRMKAEVPVIGLAKIALAGQEPGVLSVDEEWCDFLAGSAACDTWQLFFVVAILVVGVPLVVTLLVFGRRLWQRHLDRLALRRLSATDASAQAAMARATEADGTPAVPIHDATDLLSGKVRLSTAGPREGPAAWDDLVRRRRSDEGR